jgi:hypothetical protein
MAKAKSTSLPSTDDLALELVGEYNKLGTGSKAYLQGDHNQNTWGIKIPYLAPQWLFGGSDVMPAQRFIGLSGLAKSSKSTLFVEMGNWYINGGGMHVCIDNENKTSPDMFEAMSRFYGEERMAEIIKRRVFVPTGSVEDWQRRVTTAVEKAKALAARPKGSRIPILITIDSLNAKAAEKTQEQISDEGSAQARSFPVEAMQISKYLRALNLLGTTANLGFVQHLTQDISAAPTYTGPVMKESGAAIATFASSLHLRIHKAGAIKMAEHIHAPAKGPPVEGYSIYAQTERSCIGPDKRKLEIQLLWQYVEQPDGSTKQVMWYDWYSALGDLLIKMKYEDKKAYAYEKERIDRMIEFTQPKTGRVNCEVLGLKEASTAEFGKAIECTPEIREKVSKLLNISKFPDIQEVDAELGMTGE